MPTARLTITISPKCTGSMPRLTATGASTGARIRIAAKVSMNRPTTSSAMLTSSRNTSGLSDTPSNSAATCCGAW
ncbi:Uncharacterised protein [Bordetella pertussis]|nr:Uncharacterised protein [Bordetella pertussis]